MFYPLSNPFSVNTRKNIIYIENYIIIDIKGQYLSKNPPSPNGTNISNLPNQRVVSEVTCGAVEAIQNSFLSLGSTRPFRMSIRSLETIHKSTL